MTWPIDDLVAMEADELSRWLVGRGLPDVTLVFWDPHTRRFASWQEAGEADRRRALEAVAGRRGLERRNGGSVP